MEIGMIGLGRMGGNMVQRLLKGGHRVVTYDRSAEAVTASQTQGAVGSSSLENLVGQLSQPRAVWVMVPAGHFVKMVQNGIEYGMMQAFAEGFEIMDAKKEFGLDLGQIAEGWRYGSVVRSWLLDLAAAALEEDPHLDSLEAYVDDSGEGRWTVQESIDLAVPAPVITLALQQRFRSRQDGPFGVKMLAALRNQFGGHAVRRTE